MKIMIIFMCELHPEIEEINERYFVLLIITMMYIEGIANMNEDQIEVREIEIIEMRWSI